MSIVRKLHDFLENVTNQQAFKNTTLISEIVDHIRMVWVNNMILKYWTVCLWLCQWDWHIHVSTGTWRCCPNMFHIQPRISLNCSLYDHLRCVKYPSSPRGEENCIHKAFSVSLSSGWESVYRQGCSWSCWSAVNRLNVPVKHLRNWVILSWHVVNDLHLFIEKEKNYLLVQVNDR